jgi:hypothetical protein
MTTKFTPGPWRTSEPFAAFPGADLRFHISQDEGAPYTPHYSDVAQFVAETIPGEKLAIQEANARLIAAAPELLEACEAAWNCIAELPPTQDRVELAQMLTNAIAKAKGEQQ